MKKLLFFFLIVFSGCALIYQDKANKMLTTWIGHHKDELIKTWGIPARDYKLSDGSSMIDYQFSETSNNNGVIVPVSVKGTSFGVTSGGGATTDTCIVTFTTNPQSIITTWKHNGVRCY